MARIRSIHPTLFTDEAFVSLSDGAQIFYIGLWTEADDQGLFEWKPLTLKMKLRPAALTPVDPLLDELLAADRVRRYEIDGRQYGAIRNFTRFQRPKSPNSVHPCSDDIRNYVSSGREVSETGAPQVVQFPQNGEKSPQMEDVGCRREEGKKEYRFRASIVRLTQEDYDTWRKAYSAIHDFDAELTRINDALSEKKPKNWFTAASAMLAAKHQSLLASGIGKKSNYSVTGYDPDSDPAYRGLDL